MFIKNMLSNNTVLIIFKYNIILDTYAKTSTNIHIFYI